MSSHSLACPHCNATISPDESHRGEAARCAVCGRLLHAVLPLRPDSSGAVATLPTVPPLPQAAPVSSGSAQPALLTPLAETFSLPPDARATATLPPRPDSAGFPSVPGYEILGELGRGGMGVVYQARQVGLNRLVALKMILAGGHAGAALLARFKTEAEAIARLQHPNIVQVHEVGEHEGQPFFSLEFCPGGSLDRNLQGTPLPPRDAARLAETLARAMHPAHQAHVVHRDLKPAKVLLGADGTPKITDFGRRALPYRTPMPGNSTARGGLCERGRPGGGGGLRT